jgi:hypothetical protein
MFQSTELKVEDTEKAGFGEHQNMFERDHHEKMLEL